MEVNKEEIKEGSMFEHAAVGIWMDWHPDATGRDGLPDLGPQEGQQVGVKLTLVRAHESVGRARIDLQCPILELS